jgi:hypothetical protein
MTAFSNITLAIDLKGLAAFFALSFSVDSSIRYFNHKKHKFYVMEIFQHRRSGQGMPERGCNLLEADARKEAIDLI